MKLKGQVALITGASRGLGLAIARALGAEGASIACLARPGVELDQAVATLTAEGYPSVVLPADVTVADQVERAVQRVADHWGRLDMVVLNAGTWQGARVHETTEKMWNTLLDLNLKGAFLTLKYALPTLIAARRGTVIGIGSFGAWVGQPGSAAYAASKWGLRGLLESVALEVKPYRVRVGMVHPHNMNSLGRAIDVGSPERDRFIEPGEVASLIAWICAAPEHVSVGNVTIWPVSAGIAPA